MSWVQALILGVTQGLTEFIPVSSSGHLILVPWALGWTAMLRDADVTKTFDVALHMGTLLAVVVYFAPDLWRLRRQRRLLVLLLVATVPAGLFGVLLEDLFERATQPWVIAVALTAFGAVMLVADRRARKEREIDDLEMTDAVVVGAAQALALVPGVSRSGVTISAGIALRQSRETAARFSFLLSIPVITGAGLKKGVDLVSHGFPSTIGPGAFAIGIAASAVSGFAAVALMLSYLKRGSLTVFVAYRWLAAAVVLALIISGARPATVG